MSIPELRVQIAFGSEPAAATDVWTDVTSWTDLTRGVSLGRGRADERSRTTAHTCTLTLDNKDGRFTAASPASPYYPNVRVGRKLRVSVRVGTARGNLLEPEDASFEGGTTGSWDTTYFGSPAAVTLANSATHPSHGSKGLLVTYPTAAAGAGPQLRVPTVIGRTYTARCVVWVAAGTPAVRFGGIFSGTTVDSTTTGAFETLTVTWEASSEATFLGLRSTAATTAGQQCWLDAVQVDEGDANLGTFTTTAPPISDRYTGYVLEWPSDFPGGNVAEARITATDRIGYLDALREMGSAPAEAILATDPVAYWPLTDPSGATSAAEKGGKGEASLEPATVGAGGGALKFGSGTGPSTDGASALMLEPTSTTDGKYLSCRMRSGAGFYDLAALVCFNTSTAAQQTLVRLVDCYGWRLDLGVDATGKLAAHEYDPFIGQRWALASSTVAASGATRVAAVRMALSGGTCTVTLWLDGVQVASTSYAATNLPYTIYAQVGGNSTGGDLFTGTMSHAAVWGPGATAVDVAAISSAILTGLAGNTINGSLEAVRVWAGINTAELITETGLLTETAHRDPAGKSPAGMLLDLADDEGGVLYVDGSGRYRMQARDHRWTRSPVVEVDSQHLRSTDLSIEYGTQGLANDATVSRPGSGGGGARVVNADSVAALGRIDRSVSVAALQDADLLARAGWEANYRATPYPRISSLPLDLLTMDEALTLSMLAVDVGDAVTLVTLPGQAAAQAFDLAVEGWSERISLTEWTIDANTSRWTGLPSSPDAVSGQRLLLIDDATTGLDMGFITGY